MRAAWAAINLDALAHNLRLIRQQAPGKRIIAVLKANAYGHGLARIAEALSSVEALGVARLDEALELRKSGITQPIVLLEGFFAAEQLPVLAAGNIQPVLHHEWQIEALLAHGGISDPLKVWLKVDTGMHRLGVEPDSAKKWYQALSASQNVNGQPVLMSHLACADDSEHEKNSSQLGVFGQLVLDIEPVSTSLANSAALFATLGAEYDWVRPGLALYGINPLTRSAPENSPVTYLRPVMNLNADVISTRAIGAGDTVGYGATWSSAVPTQLGIVAIGYGDGYPRHAPEGTPVWINGVCYPLVGRVAMDMITVNLGAESSVKVGDTAQLWGEQLPVETVAKWVGTIPYELLCNVAKRVTLEY
ncbi:alanine racemase [Aliidiomarina celeris]|uniref:alanine racemase n=1 Tax=Aliidiomarina celeris TaxID=2249428 RepID=UPI000DEB4188|nr:alanine racemase [Aliidiomarina celeris]